MREATEEIRRQTLEQLDLSTDLTDEQVLAAIEQAILAYGREHYLPLSEKYRLKDEIFHGIRGLDILEELLADDSVTEIMINGHENIFYEKKGKLYLWENDLMKPLCEAEIVQ